jgi:hypothetical protein
MRIALAHLKSASPYGQSKAIAEKKSRDETHDDFEERSWRGRCHVDSNGLVFIPPMAFKNCLAEAAKYKSIQIPGKGKSTYTKHFEAGVMCKEILSLGIKVEDMLGMRLHVPSDGRRGGGSRVWKTFPYVDAWEGDVEYCVLDEMIDNDVFEQHLRDSGMFIGIGFFRPRNNGFWGRFSVEGISWQQL